MMIYSNISKETNEFFYFFLKKNFQIDDSIASKMIDAKYSKYKFKEYFLLELKPFIEKTTNDRVELNPFLWLYEIHSKNGELIQKV